MDGLRHSKQTTFLILLLNPRRMSSGEFRAILLGIKLELTTRLPMKSLPLLISRRTNVLPFTVNERVASNFSLSLLTCSDGLSFHKFQGVTTSQRQSPQNRTQNRNKVPLQKIYKLIGVRLPDYAYWFGIEVLQQGIKQPYINVFKRVILSQMSIFLKGFYGPGFFEVNVVLHVNL